MRLPTTRAIDRATVSTSGSSGTLGELDQDVVAGHGRCCRQMTEVVTRPLTLLSLAGLIAGRAPDDRVCRTGDGRGAAVDHNGSDDRLRASRSFMAVQVVRGR